DSPNHLLVPLSGLHTWQWMVGCELRGDGSKGGFLRYGYDGRTFISFDKETLTWVAPEPQAQITQRKWDAVPGFNQRRKADLEEICIEWLEKHLSYGKDTLLRTDGTYHYWLSIRIDPQERDRYRCHVEHDGLQEPVDVDVKGERPQGGRGWALFQGGGLWESNLTPAVSRCEHP
ncbi:major histocompatibility complex class I-related gene protein-like, partial [Python bivittatus]|uniref:Major histocompatibility complex class I-related gene protein-like n=1 Tax=Python bivittatus TaxID=176946 RepID=A0A9F5J5F2_PYTBI